MSKYPNQLIDFSESCLPLIYELGSRSYIYFSLAGSVISDVIINNIPKEACINNINGYNIIKRIHYDYIYNADRSGVGYASLYSKPNFFYPINLNKINMELRNDTGKIDILDSLNRGFSVINTETIGKFSFEFELTILNKNI